MASAVSLWEVAMSPERFAIVFLVGVFLAFAHFVLALF